MFTMKINGSDTTFTPDQAYDFLCSIGCDYSRLVRNLNVPSCMIDDREEEDELGYAYADIYADRIECRGESMTLQSMAAIMLNRRADDEIDCEIARCVIKNPYLHLSYDTAKYLFDLFKDGTDIDDVSISETIALKLSDSMKTDGLIFNYSDKNLGVCLYYENEPNMEKLNKQRFVNEIYKRSYNREI